MRRLASSRTRPWGRLGLILLGILALAAVVTWFMQASIPRRIVIATGPAIGAYHGLAQQYAAQLAREGITLVERPTEGAVENMRLLADPASGVDVAFVQGGLGAGVTGVEMLAGLYYEALWIFYRDPSVLTHIDQLRGKRIALGHEGSGTRALTVAVLEANDVTPRNSTYSPLNGLEAVEALRRGEVDAIVLMGPPQGKSVSVAIRDPSLKLMSISRADAYPRHFPFLTKLVLPAGAISLAQDLPATEVTLLGTKAMLVAREGLPTPIVDLLIDAASDIHGEASHFANSSEFPSVARVDLPVSDAAQRHHKFGPRVLQRYLPFFVATYLEQLIVVLLPLLVIFVPLFNVLPQILRWRSRSRIYRWYGELALLEREIDRNEGDPPLARWNADLDRIERSASHVKAPASYASELYTLREHIDFVRRAVRAKASGTP